MKELFKDGKYTAYGIRTGATYSVEIRDTEGTPVAWKWFHDEDKTAEEHVSDKFHAMIKRAIWKA